MSEGWRCWAPPFHCRRHIPGSALIRHRAVEDKESVSVGSHAGQWLIRPQSLVDSKLSQRRRDEDQPRIQTYALQNVGECGKAFSCGNSIKSIVFTHANLQNCQFMIHLCATTQTGHDFEPYKALFLKPLNYQHNLHFPETTCSTRLLRAVCCQIGTLYFLRKKNPLRIIEMPSFRLWHMCCFAENTC